MTLCFTNIRLGSHGIFHGLLGGWKTGLSLPGGNDNKLCIWSLKSTEPVLKFTQHQAAVKVRPRAGPSRVELMRDQQWDPATPGPPLSLDGFCERETPIVR